MLYKNFRIDELFSVDTSNTYGSSLKDSEIIDEEGKTPYVANIITNNGIAGYSRYEPNNEGNAITLSDTVTSVYDTIYYQKDGFIGKSHIQVLRPLKIMNENGEMVELFSLNERIALYIITCMKKSVKSGDYDYGTKFNSTAIKETIINLPVKTGDATIPDLEYMDDFIKKITPKYFEILDYKIEELKKQNEDYKKLLTPFIKTLTE